MYCMSKYEANQYKIEDYNAATTEMLDDRLRVDDFFCSFKAGIIDMVECYTKAPSNTSSAPSQQNILNEPVVTELRQLHHHVSSQVNALKILGQPVNEYDAWLVTLLCCSHQVRQCRDGNCNKCKKWHNTKLHSDAPFYPSVSVPQSQPIITYIGLGNNNSTAPNQIILATILVNLTNTAGHHIQCSVILDSGSQPISINLLLHHCDQSAIAFVAQSCSNNFSSESKAEDHLIITCLMSILVALFVYDPAGFLTPALIHEQFCMLQLWTLKLNWDTSLLEALQTKWTNFC
ncbi:Retrotransposon, Pao [Cinara cedri]|uniref:Retrotransposon, Pao n=1 Tax=Cinara cedri TaxID=506608 RepID=A0A5E4NEX7_9HEMI|nr:Retrotransposon, Pao [Cinara cedri]